MEECIVHVIEEKVHCCKLTLFLMNLSKITQIPGFNFPLKCLEFYRIISDPLKP